MTLAEQMLRDPAPARAEPDTSDGSRRPLTQTEMASQLARLAPFHHALELPFGLNTYDPTMSRHDRERTRLASLTDHLWPTLLSRFGGSLAGKRVLDVACNCGGFAMAAAKAGAAEVVGIDVDAHYIEQATFIRDALEMRSVSFRVARLEDLDPEKDGTFDVVFFFGILYHLPDPIGALDRISALTRDMLVVDTSLLRFRLVDRYIKWPLWRMKVVPAMTDNDHDITTGRWRTTQACQFYPNRRAVFDALNHVGFDEVNLLPAQAPTLEPRYYQGKRATFIARKRRA